MSKRITKKILSEVKRLESKNRKLKNDRALLLRFMQQFAQLFDFDWHHTVSCLQKECLPSFIGDYKATFCRPDIPMHELSNNWSSRHGFIERYNQICDRFPIINDRSRG